MRIPIKNPYLARQHTALLCLGILSLLALAGIGTAVFFAGGALQAWKAAGAVIRDICEEDFTCNASFILLCKIGPFFVLGAFIFALWEKYTKFRAPLPGTYFTHITFGPDGVQLEKPHPAQNVFFPYKETTLDVTIQIFQITTRRTPVTVVSDVTFTFTQIDGKSQTIQHCPPSKTLPFLCKILDHRSQFARFSYKTTADSYADQQAAHALQTKLDGYCKTGFASEFNSPLSRAIVLIMGLLCVVFGTISPLAFYLLSKDSAVFYFAGGFLILIPLGVWLLLSAAKDICRERKSRKK